MNFQMCPETVCVRKQEGHSWHLKGFRLRSSFCVNAELPCSLSWSIFVGIVLHLRTSPILVIYPLIRIFTTSIVTRLFVVWNPFFVFCLFARLSIEFYFFVLCFDRKASLRVIYRSSSILSTAGGIVSYIDFDLFENDACPVIAWSLETVNLAVSAYM